MSWTVTLLRIRGERRPADTVPEEDYLPLGTRAGVLAAISRSFPDLHRPNARQVFYLAPEFSIEFLPDDAEPVRFMILEVRGTGDPLTPILKLAQENGWLALDCSTGEFIDPDHPERSGWSGYVDLLRDLRARER